MTSAISGASEALPNSAPADLSVPGWVAFADTVRDLPGRMLARLPPAMQADPRIRQEVGRLALAAITSMSIDAIGGDGDHPVFNPTIGQTLNVGQPNADTIYRIARITPGGSYRIRGKRGTLPIVAIGESGPSPYEPGWSPEKGLRPHHDVNALTVDAEGRYDVLLSPERPPHHEGDWWPLRPGTTKLLLRMVSSAWGRDRDPTFSIERVDAPVTRARPPAAILEAALRQLPQAIAFIATLFVDHVAKLRSEGFVNTLKTLDVSQIGGLAGQYYYEGAYEIADDEALIVEAKVPKTCLYHSVILTNDIYETIDWTDNQSSLNDSQSEIDADGMLRVVVAGADPGVPNWIDTAGHRSGLIQGRWTGCDSHPIPTVRRVRLAVVREALPHETRRVSPAEREHVIRERRAAFQQRPLW